MLNISSLVRMDREFTASVESLKESIGSPEHLPIAVNGLSGGAEDAFITEYAREARRLSGAPVLILAPNDEERARIGSFLRSSGLDVLEYKKREFVFHNISASHDTERERLSVLQRLSLGECDVLVATPASALGYTMPTKVLQSSSVLLRVGDEISPEKLVSRLVGMGFSLSDIVEGRGQCAHRGGIVDFFGDTEEPVRVEFFGDEIDRLVYFDPMTQRATDVCRAVSVLPACEAVIDADGRTRILKEIDTLLKNPKASDEVRQRLLRERAQIAEGLVSDFRDKYFGVIYESTECLLDYYLAFGGKSCIIVGTSAVRECAEEFVRGLCSAKEGMLSVGSVTRLSARYCADIEYYNEFLTRVTAVHINSFAGGIGTAKLQGLFGFRSRRCVSYGDNPAMLREDLLGLRRALYRIILLTSDIRGAESLCESLRDNDIPSAVIRGDNLPDMSECLGGQVLIGVADFRGFDLVTPKIAVLSMARDEGRAIMANKRRQRVLRRVGGAGKRLMSHNDLTVGDYVVHANYGIGLFEGIEAVTVDGVTKDYITIRYAGTDKLFVPCDRLEMIGKYIGAREKDGTVKLSRMGGTDWARTKLKAKSAAKDIAKNLIQLYAERQRMPGFAFPKECELEDEFDSRFEYEETESQLIAIKEIKDDMMRPVPMNRLLCGDVGFGKTEVALRAAFKAILAGKQVALLVPTTILALQHYQTAISRMRGYAVNVEMLSRFRKPKERASVIERTAKGDVDLLIGTHAILSKQVKFRDLGLLIIDEEQRFGVMQKEKLREMSENVDTLMLSATPIPRTLNMSLSGINDISVLDEAPGERRPVQTYVLEHDNALINDAISRELMRGGQVLYLYNKVEDIHLVAGRIADALPMARVAFAHGQMEREELEDIWHSLVGCEIDVLVCTTIIETGVDLPNANTLIIENADRFGLSQLHQIRGRVGRSERQAYAFFTFRPGKALTEIAEKRLQAIREFAEFGAGFKIAQRDLEIRGAGNLLGAEQHGYIESVGYDLYIKLLNEAVLEEKGEKTVDRAEAQISINLSAHIPESYIKSLASRMEMYKKISLVETEEDRDDIYDELTDRFGEPPKPTVRLLDVALCKALASRAGIRKLEAKDLRLSFISDMPRLEIWSELFAKYPELSFVGVGSPIIAYRMRKGDDPTEIGRKILSEYATIAGQNGEENGK